MADNNFASSVEAMMKSMDGYLHTKNVVGDPIKIGDNIILPLSEVSFGIGAGAYDGNVKSNGGGGGMGGKMSTSALLVIGKDGSTKLVNVKSSDAVSKIMEMVPDLINRFTKGGKNAEEADAEGVNEADFTEE